MSRYGQDMSTSLVKTSLCYPSLRHCRYQSGCFNTMEKFEAYGMARLYIQYAMEMSNSITQIIMLSYIGLNLTLSVYVHVHTHVWYMYCINREKGYLLPT